MDGIFLNIFYILILNTFNISKDKWKAHSRKRWYLVCTLLRGLYAVNYGYVIKGILVWKLAVTIFFMDIESWVSILFQFFFESKYNDFLLTYDKLHFMVEGTIFFYYGVQNFIINILIAFSNFNNQRLLFFICVSRISCFGNNILIYFLISLISIYKRFSYIGSCGTATLFGYPGKQFLWSNLKLFLFYIVTQYIVNAFIDPHEPSILHYFIY